jgi:hypothetical protein
MKRVMLVMVSLFLSFCLVPPAYAAWLDDVKKAVEGVTKPADKSNQKQDKKTPVATTNVKAFGLSWDATLEQAISHLKAKDFNQEIPPWWRRKARDYKQKDLMTDFENWRYVNLSAAYTLIAAKKLKSFDIAKSTYPIVISKTGKSIRAVPNKKNSNIREITYFFDNKNGLFACVINVRSEKFGLKALEKYGPPKKVGGIVYIYPSQGDIGIALHEISQGADIYYINIPKTKAYNSEVKVHVDAIEAKKKAEQDKESKDF